jgi:hypothetical protein
MSDDLFAVFDEEEANETTTTNAPNAYSLGGSNKKE